MRLDIKWRREGNIAIAALLGRIDSSNSNDFLAMTEEGVVPGDGALLLDFEKVSFISSAGLRICLILAKKLSSSGQAFAMCSLSEFNREVVAVSGFDKLISVHTTVEAALSSLQSS
ncbi:MAG: STAS domain-containing protein [Bacteroidota bacterium]|nr:STAS domain-containing protein [Bacteroidota bacterium]